MDIKVDDLTGSQIQSLLEEHLQSMMANTPEGSVHALDLTALRAPEITFWSVWSDDDLMGCAALKELDAQHAELKSMRTASTHLRKGVANNLLNHVLKVATERHYQSISLETGSGSDFEPARKLYTNAGFSYCKPFADYTEDPNSVFLKKLL